MTTAVPFLTFQPAKGHTAQEAMWFYVEVFEDGEVLWVRQHGAGSPGAGTVELAEFTVAGQRFRCSDSFIEHAWDFTPAWSVWLECTSPEEQQQLFTALGRGGREHMPLDDYGFGRFGWVEDRFGINWQLGVEQPPPPAEG